ncbi:hypothetical protein ACFQ07_24230, partial [Actinomadura adrarensis]
MERTPQTTSEYEISDNERADASTGMGMPSQRQWQGAVLPLLAALEGRGLIARTRDQGSVWVRNPAGDPDPDDPRAQALSPCLQQEVVCRLLGGAPWWLWAWAGTDRNSPADLEPLCPA